jgi:DNA mismatch repair protein MutS
MRCATHWTVLEISNVLAARPRQGGAPRVSCGRWATRWSRCPAVVAALQRVASDGRLGEILAQWDDAAELAAEITSTLVERPPIAIGDDSTIAHGFDANLDRLRGLRDGGKDAIARIQAEEKARTGIASLKIGFNKVFGYYIEVTNSNLHLVPADYQRRQTITSGERFVTPALKSYEENVLTAAEQIETCERELFDTLRTKAGRQIDRLQRIARAIAELDVLSTLADVAAREGYVRPTMTDDFDLEIVAGRHPVVERMMPRDKFIPNDLRLTRDGGRMIILTGPNMAGQIHRVASDRIDRTDGADRQLRSGVVGADRRRRSHFHALLARATISCAASRRSWWR